MIRPLFIISLVAAILPSSFLRGDEQSGIQKPAQLNTQVKVEMDFLLYLPKDYDKQESWPLVLFLHGAGERGDDIELVKKHGPPKLIGEGTDFPFIVVSPQCQKERRWEPFELTVLLDHIIESHKVDEDRIYVTGLSMGGFGTWRLAAYTPDRFAAIAPICGGGDAHSSKLFSHLPTWVFHGAKDKVVPLERSQEMIDALREKGGLEAAGELPPVSAG